VGRSEYGGWPELTTEATGCFRVERLIDRYWLVDPEGMGVTMRR